MAVYVDDMEAPFGRMEMCHMIADSSEELLIMADAIGVGRKWIQDRGTSREHFDVTLSKKKLALAHGAVEIEYGVVLAEMLAQRDRGERMAPRRVKPNSEFMFR